MSARTPEEEELERLEELDRREATERRLHELEQHAIRVGRIDDLEDRFRELVLRLNTLEARVENNWRAVLEDLERAAIRVRVLEGELEALLVRLESKPPT